MYVLVLSVTKSQALKLYDISDKLGSAYITLYQFQTLDISFICWKSVLLTNKSRMRSWQVSFKVFY